MRTKMLATLSLAVLLSAAYALAQTKSIHANIPFPFTVEGKAFPAGSYDFARNANNQSIEIIGIDKKQSGGALVITRLGVGIHTTPQDAHIVFDKVGDTYFLSELWYWDIDGFLLRATKEKHEHRAVDVPKG